MDHQIPQAAADFPDGTGQGPFMASSGCNKGTAALGIDDIHDRFCFRKVKTAIEKSPFCKFSRFCWSCPFAKGQPQDFFQRFPSAMALDFHHVFSRVGMGARHIDCQDLIHIDTLPVMDMTILQITGTGRGKGFFCPKNPIDETETFRSADADDAHGANAQGGRNGTDCIFHDSSKKKLRTRVRST